MNIFKGDWWGKDMRVEDVGVHALGIAPLLARRKQVKNAEEKSKDPTWRPVEKEQGRYLRYFSRSI